MNYIEVHKIMEGLKVADLNFHTKADVVQSVYINIDIHPYDEEGINELCERIYKYWTKNGMTTSLDNFTYAIQDQMDNGAHELPNDDCLDDAWRQALEMTISDAGGC